ncbi:MAG: hypothetical protein J2P45_16360 [Candidatus Dormibacteraeota bacterium]|nr:hypothetical protein [Candidatus Dormibacteraeota bacterium]
MTNQFPAVNLLAWIVSHWRLKLLALVLAIGLLATAAFSQNPPQYTTIAEKVEYVFPTNSNLVVISPKTSVDVQVFGLRSAIQDYISSPAGVSVDLTGAKPGADQHFYAHPKNAPAGLSFRSTQIPVTLNIEPLNSKVLPVEVRVTAATGVEVTDKLATCGNEAQSCEVQVTGPTSLLQGLRAFVNYSVTSAGNISAPNQKVVFEQNGKPIDLSQFSSVPSPSWNPSTVAVSINTTGGSQTKQVPISYTLTGTPSCGYSVSRVDLAPAQMVTIQGPINDVSSVSQIALSPVDITGLAGTRNFTRSLSTGSNAVKAQFTTVSVTVTTQQVFSCASTSPRSPAPVTPSGG